MEMLETAVLGRRVRQRRLAMGIGSQAELAERAELSPSYVSRLEAGQAGVKVDELLKVAKALGMRLSDLVGETDEELVAEVRRRLPNGSEIALNFERLARALPGQSQDDQEFIRRSIAILVERYGEKSDTPE